MNVCYTSFLTFVIWFLTRFDGKVVDGANILVLVPTPSFSHQIFYEVYLRELHNRGHNLTVATPNPINDPNMTNYREIDLSYGYEHLRKALISSFGPATPARMIPELYFIFAAKVVDVLCEKLLSDENLMALYRSGEKFDLVVLEWGINYCFYPFEKLSDGKFIGIASYEIGSFTHLGLGNPSNPSHVPDTSLDFSDEMTFWERVRNTLFYLSACVFVNLIRWNEYQIAKKHFGPDSESVYVIAEKVALVLDNSLPAMTYPRPTGVNFIGLGGPAFHLNKRKQGKLPKDIQDFMDGAEHGVIYFSLGSNVKTAKGFEKEEKILLESFSRVKQRVLFKWENENLRVNLDNVKVSKWFPQVDILGHPKVKAFVTQGGLQSIGEAIHHRVPMISIPFFADQGHNSMKMESVGVAITLDIGKLNVEDFTQALKDIVSNKTYKENMIKFHELVNDQPMPPLEKAVWWTEYVIRHNGAPHLRSVAATMPWYQYLLLDVLAAFLLIIFLFIYIFRMLLKLLFNLMFRKKKSKKN